MGTLAIVLFVVGIIGSIMLHEWGHFATARRFGMRADRFFVGFGPTLWSTHRGETEYGVKAFPIGGFVRIKGMSPTDERLLPVADQVFDPEVVAELRRGSAAAAGVAVTTVPGVPDALWDQLDRQLLVRGATDEQRVAIIRHARRGIGADATPDEAAVATRRAIEYEVRDTGRVGDLHHRLTKGDEGRFFHDRPAWQRAIVLVAGSTMHMVQALVLVFLVLMLSGPVTTFSVVDEVQAGSPADQAGLQPGDEIVAVAGQQLDDFDLIRAAIRERPGQPTNFTVLRDGVRIEVIGTPAIATDDAGQPLLDDDGQTFGRFGFLPVVDNVPLPVGEALVRTFSGDGSVPDLTVRTFSMLGQVFGPEGVGSIFSQVQGDQDRDSAGAISVVGAAGVAAEGADAFGLWLTIATLLASINVFIGVFNILPLPPLDGGHLAVLGVEKSVNTVRSLRGGTPDFTVDPRAVAAVAVPVIALIGTISVALLWLDIVNPVSLR